VDTSSCSCGWAHTRSWYFCVWFNGAALATAAATAPGLLLVTGGRAVSSPRGKMRRLGLAWRAWSSELGLGERLWPPVKLLSFVFCPLAVDWRYIYMYCTEPQSGSSGSAALPWGRPRSTAGVFEDLELLAALCRRVPLAPGVRYSRPRVLVLSRLGPSNSPTWPGLSS
jgi:hypothetical protein